MGFRVEAKWSVCFCAESRVCGELQPDPEVSPNELKRTSFLGNMLRISALVKGGNREMEMKREAKEY